MYYKEAIFYEIADLYELSQKSTAFSKMSMAKFREHICEGKKCEPGTIVRVDIFDCFSDFLGNLEELLHFEDNIPIGADEYVFVEV